MNCHWEYKPQKNGAYKIAVTVLTVSLLLLLLLDILVLKFQIEEAEFKNTGPFLNELVEYPVFCEDLSLSPSEDYDTFNVKKKTLKYSLYNNNYVCSYRNLTEAVAKVVERKSRLRLSKGQEQQPYLQCGNESLRESSGHLSAFFIKTVRHQTFKGHGKGSIIHWDKHPESAFISEKLEYHKDKLTVPEARFYFLFASVLMNISCIDNRPGHVCRFFIRICATRRGHERILLQKMTIYNTTDNNAVSTLNVGSHILLARGDSIFVRVSEAGRVVSESAGNVFGIIPLR